MRPDSRANQVAFRKAVVASVGVHLFAALALVVLVCVREEQPPGAPVIDTRAEAAPHVTMHLAEEPVVIVEPQAPVPSTASPPVPPSTPPDVPPQPSIPPDTQTEPTAVPLHAGPFTQTPPRTLPTELTALLRKPAPVAVQVPMHAGSSSPP